MLNLKNLGVLLVSVIFVFVVGGLEFNRVFAREMTLEEEAKMFETMSVEELNAYIHEIAQNEAEVNVGISNCSINSNSRSQSSAWLAAAEILIQNGYVCAGTLLKESALNASYYKETNNGVIISAILEEEKFSDFVDMAKIELKNGNNFEDGINFETADSIDLFLSLHNCTVEAEVMGIYQPGFTAMPIHVHDVYDFALFWNDDDYKDLFVTLVNDAAWLSTHLGLLSVFPVDLYFRV